MTVSSAPMLPASPLDTSRLSKSTEDYARLAAQCVAPPEAADLWSWCKLHLRTYHGTKWDPERAELMRFWYKVAGARLTGRPDPAIPGAHLAEQIWLSLCSQIAKSTWLYAILLYCLRNAPRRIGFYQGRLKDLKLVRKTRVERMLLQIPQLEKLLPRGSEARERALGENTWTVGTALAFWLCGAVGDDCRLHDLPLMLLDEFDTYPDDVEGVEGTDKGQGDPIELLIPRQRTFGRTRLMAGASSPGMVHGHAWRRVAQGASHHRPLILCPSCAGAGWLDWRRLAIVGDRKLAEVHPEEIVRAKIARWVCQHCGEMHAADAVRGMVKDCARNDRWCPGAWAIDADHPTGHWSPLADLEEKTGRLIAIRPWEGRVWSGQAGSLYSVDESVDTVAARVAIAEQGKVTQRKTIHNTEHAEPWIHIATSDDQDTAAILNAAQDPQAYLRGSLPPNCPARWLVLGWDQQGNRRDEWWFPWVLRAVAPGGDSWKVASGKARSEAERDTISQQLWNIDGQTRRVDFELMDIANGHFTFDGYLWASQATNRRICFRGDSRLADGIPWQEVIDEPRRRKTPRPAGVREFKIAPHHWRTRLWDRMRRRPGEPRWILPSNPDPVYLRSLTSEEQIVERLRVAGIGWQDVIVWRPRLVQSTNDESSFRKDNHWFVIEVAITAAINFLGFERKLVPVARPGRGTIRIGA